MERRGAGLPAAGKRTQILGALELTISVWTATVADLLSKWLAISWLAQAPSGLAVTPFLNLRLTYNSGISFGLFPATTAGSILGLIALATVLVVALLWLALRARGAAERIGYGLIVGGAVGNMIDRMHDGVVTDFLDVHASGWHWPAFNLADVTIAGGVALLLVGAVSSVRGARAADDD